MPTPPPRIVAVFGSTGLQGASVVHALLKDGTFTPRAITRDPESKAAIRLKTLGVEITKADATDKASVVAALTGCEAVFALTTFNFHAPGPDEREQGKNIVDAAQEANVKFFIWSSLPSLAKLSDGKYTQCVQYEYKAHVEEYLRASGMPNASLHLGVFLENLWKFGALQKTESGSLEISVPSYGPADLQAFTWAGRDVGTAALALLKNYTDSAQLISGKAYPVITARMSFADLAGLASQGACTRCLALSLLIRIQRWASMFRLCLGGRPEWRCWMTWCVHSSADFFRTLNASTIQYEFQATRHGLYTETAIPNPELLALGMEFGTVEEFMKQDVVPRFK
ncbi:unnamed protein product [Mycena citricolor]|uniref:NmrA-like domain-containing protein n=1 Tax=Mycena citricolor TaxID=2018698 RepID=A0AAD2JZR3_9AGAR|nr:unnamed protein product [Mycena citricolor]